jgi:hypothetical protein
MTPTCSSKYSDMQWEIHCVIVGLLDRVGLIVSFHIQTYRRRRSGFNMYLMPFDMKNTFNRLHLSVHHHYCDVEPFKHLCHMSYVIEREVKGFSFSVCVCVSVC